MTAVPCLMFPEGTVIEQEPKKEGDAVQDPEHITSPQSLYFGKKINRNAVRDRVSNLSKARSL